MSQRIKLCNQADFGIESYLRITHPHDKNKSILIIQKNNILYAYENSCPHFSIPLDYKKGVFHTYRNEVIMCAHHSAMFTITTGECVDGPCRGHSLTAVPIEVQDKEVFFTEAQS